MKSNIRFWLMVQSKRGISMDQDIGMCKVDSLNPIVSFVRLPSGVCIYNVG
jgi:hypothetical protein